MPDRRQSLRRRTLLTGRVEVEKLNGWMVSCTVRNLSADGARIAIDDPAVVPDRFQLGVSGRPAQPARLVWYRDGQAGVDLAS